MKKITLAALFLVAATFVVNAQTRFGIKAGLNLADANGKGDGESFSSDSKMRVGFHLGGVADITFAEKFYFQPGLLFSTKGAKFETEDSGVKFTSTANLGYLEVPLNVGYRIDAGSAKINLGLGPYLGFGVAGKFTTKVSGGGISAEESENVKWGNDEDSNVKPLDFGLNLGAGVEFSNFQINLQYGLGLSNNRPKGDSDNSLKNSVIGISLGYFFGGSK